MNTTRPRWSSQTKLTVSLLLVGFFIYLLFRFSAVLPPLILAVILAYVLAPLVSAFQRRAGLSRGLSTFLVYVVIIVLLALIPMLILPPLARQLVDLTDDIQRLFLQLESLMASEISISGRVVIDVEAFLERLRGGFESALEPMVGRTFEVAIDVISSLIWIVFILVVSFYLIKDGPALREYVESHIPPRYRADFSRLRDRINGVWSAFFRGQLLLALVVAVIFTVFGLVLGLPFALAMGVLAGLLEFLPSIGHGIWLLIASVLALTAGSTWIPVPNWVFMLIILGLHVVFQQFDLNYLIPRIIGRRVQLPPLVVIFGIVAGATIAGVLGVVLAAPTIASARVLGRYVFAYLFDLDPFPDREAVSLPTPDPTWWRVWGRLRVDSPIPTDHE